MEKPTHFRRCHICGEINEKDGGRVQKCSHCGKSLAPFYYFDDRFTAIAAEGSLRPPSLEGVFMPIQGLTAYWESF